MTRLTRMALLLVVAAAAPLSALAWTPGYFESKPILFNGPPIDCSPPSPCAEMFRYPALSGSTAMYILPNVTDWDLNGAFRASGLQSEGAAAEQVFFTWNTDPNIAGDPNFAWVRLITFNSTGEPNPSLHLQGKVRFMIGNLSGWDPYAKFGLCLGIRETGTNVAQMDDGGTAGTIEWVGVSSKRNAITAGADRVVNTTASGDDVQIYALNTVMDPNIDIATAVIGPGPNGKIDTVPAGDDQYRSGFDVDPIANVRRPIPVVTVPGNVLFPVPIVFDLATGNVTPPNTSWYVDPNDRGGFAGFTGDGVLSAPNNRGVLEHLAFTKDKDADLGGLADSLAIDELKFEAPAVDPTLPPEVAAPLVQGASTVTVQKLMYWCRAVRWYKGATLMETWTNPDPNNADPAQHPASHAFTASPTLNTGEVITAQQQNHEDGTWSASSVPVVVLSGPPPYTFCTVLDEAGNGSCTAANWEFVAATSSGTGNVRPVGMNILPNDAVWQTLDIPMTNPALVQNAMGYGNGILDPNISVTTFYTWDSWWFTAADPNYVGSTKTNEVYVDRVEDVDPNGNVTGIIFDFEDGLSRITGLRGQSPSTTYTVAGISSNAAYDGTYSQRFVWYFSDFVTANSIGFLERRTSEGQTCATRSGHVNKTDGWMRFHVLSRGLLTQPTIPLPTVTSPIIAGTQTAIRINCRGYASNVYLFINGIQSGAPINPNGATYVDFTGLTLTSGQSVSAKQVISGVTSDFAYPKAALAYTPKPTVVSPIIPTATQVTVGGLTTVPYASASAVTVYVRDPNGALTQTVPQALDPNNPVSSTTVTVAALTAGYSVTATQTVNGVTSAASTAVVVATPSPTIYMAPAAGDTSVTILDVIPGASAVRVYVYPDPNVGSATMYSATPGGGNPSVVVVTGIPPMVAGGGVRASQVYAGVESVYSIGDPITEASLTQFGPAPWPDTMESYACQKGCGNNFENQRYPLVKANQGWWLSSKDPAPFWTGDANFPATYPGKQKNATPGGSKSAYVPAGQTATLDPVLYPGANDTEVGWNNGYQGMFDTYYATPTSWGDFMGSWSQPLVWNVNIYDSGGPGVDNMYQWAEARNYTSDSTLNGLFAVGMPGSSFFSSGLDNNYYSGRVIVGNGSGIGYVNLDRPGTPTRTIGWHTFTVVGKYAPYTYCDFYVDGVLARKNIAWGGNAMNNLYIGSGYAATLEGWYDDYSLGKGKVIIEPRMPNGAGIVSPVMADDTLVALANIEPGATNVAVYANDPNAAAIGTANPGGASTYDVPVTPLVAGDMIMAKTTTGYGTSDVGPKLEVGKGNGDLRICIGVRETNDPGLPGQTGTGTGAIEWVGIADPNSASQPWGKALTPAAGWQTFTFVCNDPNVDKVKAMPGGGGDGIITATKGVLEHIAITADNLSAGRSSGTYYMYVDEIVNVGAGPGGTDALLANGFEGYALGSEVMFQEPTYSGTTSANLSYPPSSSTVAPYGYSSSQSDLVSWFFKDTTASRWIRLTTASVGYVSSPIVDLTRPIRMRILLQKTGACCAGAECYITEQNQCVDAGGTYKGDDTDCDPNPCAVVTGACCSTTGVCSVITQAACTGAGGHYYGNGTACRAPGNRCPASCKGDMNCDGRVTFVDIDLFVAALSGESAWTHWPCPWINADCNNTGTVNFVDIDPFVAVIGTTCLP